MTNGGVFEQTDRGWFAMGRAVWVNDANGWLARGLD